VANLPPALVHGFSLFFAHRLTTPPPCVPDEVDFLCVFSFSFQPLDMSFREVFALGDPFQTFF